MACYYSLYAYCYPCTLAKNLDRCGRYANIHGTTRLQRLHKTSEVPIRLLSYGMLAEDFVADSPVYSLSCVLTSSSSVLLVLRSSMESCTRGCAAKGPGFHVLDSVYFIVQTCLLR